MNKKLVYLAIISILFLTSMPTSLALGLKANYDLNFFNMYYVHNLDTNEDFQTIQEAIDDPDTKNGHTIKIDNGIYRESIKIKKSITLIGENKEDTIIDGTNLGSVIKISSNSVKIKNLTIKWASGVSNHDAGIFISNYNDAYISDSIFIANDHDIYLDNCRNIQIINNKFIRETRGFCGIWAQFSSNIVIDDNEFDNCNTGCGCIIIESSDNIDIKNNLITNCIYCGVYLQRSSNVDFFKNTVKNNAGSGMSVFMCIDNIFVYNNEFVSNGFYGISAMFTNGLNVYLNNFIDNDNKPQGSDYTENLWYNEDMKKGNYWNDYTGSDSDGDGVGDISYNILNGENEDIYPLMNRVVINKAKSVKSDQFNLLDRLRECYPQLSKLLQIISNRMPVFR